MQIYSYHKQVFSNLQLYVFVHHLNFPNWKILG